MLRLLARQASWPRIIPRRHFLFVIAPFALIVAGVFIHIAALVSTSSRTIPQLDPVAAKVARLLADANERERNAYDTHVRLEENLSSDNDNDDNNENGNDENGYVRIYYTHYIYQHDRKRGKIVALVELRNVQDTLHEFFAALVPVVDSVVVLDDHSADLTRALVLERCAAYKVEAVVAKTGSTWRRRELQDRQLLLRYGREVGGTHFLLLDYDERFEGPCVASGQLRKSILELSPGKSRYLPWVELWKNTAIQRVHPDDPNINFLVRRQTVVFADDGIAQYTRESTQARTFNQSSMHALRCPRDICPKPPKYRPGSTQSGTPPEECAITEGRFIHIPNVILKAAWYQALARYLGVPAAMTSGKMLDALFPAESSHLRMDMAHRSGISLKQHAFKHQHARDAGIGAKLVERWRADELVSWLDQLGDVQFRDLAALRSIDTNYLRYTAAAAKLAASRKSWLHVPRIKRGTLVFAISDTDTNSNPLEVFLRETGFATRVGGFMVGDIARRAGYMLGMGDGTRADINMDYEDWRLQIVSSVRSAISKSKYNTAYLAGSTVSSEDYAVVLQFFSVELAEFDVVILPLITETNGYVLKEAAKHARKPGSHVRVLALRRRAAASYSALCWLRNRITGVEKWGTVDSRKLLATGESLYTHNMLPVARLVFSLNTGRAGSKYLADIFASLGPGTRAFHEPKCPDGSCSGGGAMNMQNTKLRDTYSVRRDTKAQMVYRALAAIGDDGTRAFVEPANGTGNSGDVMEMSSVTEIASCTWRKVQTVTYAETNPNFKAWFWDVTLDSFPQKGYSVDVVVVRKYIPAVLKSLYETGYFTTRNGFNWMETAAGVNARLKPLENGQNGNSDAYDEILSYILNAESVTRHIVHTYSQKQNVGFVEARSEWIYTPEGALELLRNLQMPPQLRTLEIVGTKADKYASKKKAASTSLKECERRFKLYTHKYEKAGIALPTNMSHAHKYKGFAYS